MKLTHFKRHLKPSKYTRACEEYKAQAEATAYVHLLAQAETAHRRFMFQISLHFAGGGAYKICASKINLTNKMHVHTVVVSKINTLHFWKRFVF